jgi:hypothetical protein
VRWQTALVPPTAIIFELLPSRNWAPYKAVVVDGVDVLLLGDEEAEAAAGGGLERNALGLLPQDSLNVAPRVQLVRVPLRHPDGLVGVAVFDDDQVALPKEGAPLLQEVAVADGGDHNVDLVLNRVKSAVLRR